MMSSVESPSNTGQPRDVWPAATDNGRARREALEVLQGAGRTPTSLVTYEANGSLVIVADDDDRVKPLVPGLKEAGLYVTVLIVDAGASDVSLGELAGVDRVRGALDSLVGHLGAFPVRMRRDDGPVNLARLLGHDREDFDLVLDLGAEPLLRRDILPPGYLAPRDEQQLAEALEELPQLRGEFEKPKYFKYDPDICAHSSSRVVGCTRCLDACPTDAIGSIQEMIEVDPYLCQGGGVCATACPTGAITYQFPRVSDLLDSLRRALRGYRDAGGTAPVLLLHDDAAGREAVERAASELPEDVLPLHLEEVASVGMDTWLAALSYGACALYLLCPPGMPPRVRTEVEHQLNIARQLLRGLGLPDDRLQLLDASSERWWQVLHQAPTSPIVPAAGFAAFEEKRTTLNLALDHLYEHAPKQPEHVALSEGSPFGEIKVDTGACTLCMACVSVCPASALADGEDTPKLQFTEDNCVQCGICVQACPEDAITLAPGYSFDADRRRMRVLNEEEPFLCVECGKPFATRSMMERMEAKLAGHWMFQNPDQRRRLQMCETCRVQDMFRDGEGLDPYDKPAKSTHENGSI